MRRALASASSTALLLVLAACGGHDSTGRIGEADAGDPDAAGFSTAADTTTCVADAHAVSSTPDDYPSDFPMPAGVVVFHVEDRGADGVIATGVTDAPFGEVLRSMNAATSAGYRVTSGETEEADAEANWTGHGFVGRWAIKRSATCPGETVLQLLAKKSA